jgi:tetraacyldisaccharide 4'-kinase
VGLAARIEKNWYGRAAGNLWLLPLWLVFVVLSTLRRFWYQLVKPQPSAVPVLVIGNIAIGGTGKTPLITCLVRLAAEQGIRVGVVSRGYGGQSDSYPLLVNEATPVAQCGDEPALLASMGIPVAVDPNRARAVEALAGKVDLVLSDDGLQHYKMHRNGEIVVSDVTRGFGNGWLLPVGPLREPVSRLRSCDLHLVNGQDFTIQPVAYMTHQETSAPSTLAGQTVHAVAGIGNPARFFTTLRALGVKVIEHPFPDHHAFTDQDLEFNDELPVVMTEKDWVKCRELNHPRIGFLRVSALPTDDVEQKLVRLLNKLRETSNG